MSTGAVLRLEVAKLRGSRLSAAVVLGCAAAPPLFLAGLGLTSSLPTDTLFGRQLRDTGFATPLLLLTVCSSWVLPLLSALVAGDTISAEFTGGTFPLLLTRVTRTQVLLGKALASAASSVLLVAVLAGSSLLSGVLIEGTGPLLDLSGAVVGPRHAAVLVLAAWATALPPVLVYTALALLLSTATRSSAWGVAGTVVVGLVLQLAAQLGAAGPLRPLLPSTQFSAWHGLLLHPHAYGPVLTDVAVCAVEAACCLLAARALLLRSELVQS